MKKWVYEEIFIQNYLPVAKVCQTGGGGVGAKLKEKYFIIILIIRNRNDKSEINVCLFHLFFTFSRKKLSYLKKTRKS